MSQHTLPTDDLADSFRHDRSTASQDSSVSSRSTSTMLSRKASKRAAKIRRAHTERQEIQRAMRSFHKTNESTKSMGGREVSEDAKNVAESLNAFAGLLKDMRQQMPKSGV